MNKLIKTFSALLISLTMVGCSTSYTSSSNNVNNISSSNTSTSLGGQKEIVEVNVANTNTSYSSLVDMISDVKETVVDVSTYINAGSSSAGSGVITGKSSDGYYIITNHHVIDSGTKFQVTAYPSELNESKTYDAYLMGGSPKNDIAVLKIVTNDEFRVASFIDDSDAVKVGTEVVAIGNPLGIYGGTVTKGIISAVAREVYIDEIGYMRLLQTDAAINSGNSGGALFDEQGLLVGIVNSGYSSYEGLNFAIPANQARTAMESLINTYDEDGNGQLGYVVGDINLGIEFATTSIYASNNSSTSSGAVVIKSIESNSDAEKNNLYGFSNVQYGTSDYFYAVNSINDTKIESVSQAVSIIDALTLGDNVSINVTPVKVARRNQMFGFNEYYYYSGEAKTISFAVSQYVYSMPTK